MSAPIGRAPPSLPVARPATAPAPAAPSTSSKEVAADGFDGRPREVAAEVAARLKGFTSGRDEAAILSALEGLRSRAELEATFYELSRLGATLPEKLVRDVCDRSFSERLRGGIPDEAVRLHRLLVPEAGDPASLDVAVTAMRKRALELGSISKPSIAAYAAGRVAAETEPLKVFGQAIPRLDRAKANAKGTFGNDALNFAYKAYDKSKVTDVVNRLFGTEDTESPAAIERALKSPLVTGADGKPKSLGDVTVLVNGLLNLVPTPSMMFKLARHTDGPLVLASSNPDGADGYRLRELTEIWGTPVPPELKGKLWAVGDLSATMLGWPQGSDLLLEHLEVISQQFGELQKANPGLEKFDSLRDSKTTVIGYSQGALSAAAARKRLNDAGMSDVIDQLISVAGSFGGTPVADAADSAADVSGAGPDFGDRLAKLAGRVLGQVDGHEGRRALESNDPDFVKAMWTSLGLSEDLIDLGYAAHSGSAKESKVEAFFGMTAHLIERVLGGAEPSGSDGVVVASEAAIGKKTVIDEKPKTHLITWKDQDTFDRILRELP